MLPGHPLFRCALLLLLIPLGVPGCSEGCLGGGDGCRLPSPCPALRFACDGGDDTLEIRELDQAGALAARRGPNAHAAAGDVLLGNGKVVAVIAGPHHASYLDPNGGALLDLRPRDGADGLNQILQVVGILPRDAARYTERVLIDERPTRVALQLSGTLDGQPDLRVHTVYEVRPCEPGVRVRTEVVNGSADSQLLAAMDGYYWSGRELLPFTPSAGEGFVHPPFSLLSINDAFRDAPFLAASSHSPPPVSYATVSCSAEQLSGFNSSQVSALGQPRTVVPPRDYQVFERFLAVAPGGDVAAAADIAQGIREQLFGERGVTLRGRLARPGLVGSERQASILIREAGEGDGARPRSQVVPGPDGAFAARLPAGRDYVVEVHAFGRKVAERAAGVLMADRDLGEIPLTAPARVTVTVSDAMTMADLEAEIFVVPADEATRAATEGTIHGVYDKCAPWLGVPYGSSPACNRFLVPRRGGAAVEVPPGRYHFYAFRGPFHTIARETATLGAGEQKAMSFTLRALPIVPRGALSADLHVHGSASFDSSLPDADRVLSFAATAMDVIIATDHDVIYDYAAVIRDLGLEDRLSSVAGLETTGHIPFLQVPGNPFPLVVGHYNFWPLQFQPGLPRNGGPNDERVEPGALFDRVEPLYQPGRVKVIQLNHPWAEPEFGRDLGFPRALGLSLLRDLPTQDDGTPAGMYVRVPAGGHRNDDHHAQEVMNGTQNDLLLAYRAFWFYSLNQGHLRTGTANSDSHGLNDNTVGSPRSLVFCDTQAGPTFDVDRFNQAVRDGAVLGTSGPVILATVDTEAGEATYGLRLLRPAPGGKLRLEVSAAPWVPVDEIRVIVNGRLARKIDGSALRRPADPFGVDGLMRYQGELPLAELLPASGDAWLVVEAGTALPLAGDLSGPEGVPDGIPDTGDNNGDGKVDSADVEPGRRAGPLRNPPTPRDESDPRFHFAHVVPDGYPMAFTNPFVLDRNGNGRFDAPGAGGGR